jgi:hypothetical protein
MRESLEILATGRHEFFESGNIDSFGASPHKIAWRADPTAVAALGKAFVLQLLRKFVSHLTSCSARRLKHALRLAEGSNRTR